MITYMLISVIAYKSIFFLGYFRYNEILSCYGTGSEGKSIINKILLPSDQVPGGP